MNVLIVTWDPRSTASQVCLRSVRRHHPDAFVTVVACDPAAPVRPGERRAADLRFGRLRYVDLLSGRGSRFARWAALGATAAETAGEPLLALSDWSWLLGTVTDLHDAAGAGQVALLPRRTTAGLSSRGWVPGVAAFGPDHGSIASWWTDEAERRCVDETADDDPWVDFISGGAAVVTVENPAVRLAPESVGGLALGGVDGELVVDGVPARLVQLPGFDPTTWWWFSPSPEVAPEVLTSTSPELGALCRRYAAEGGPRPGLPERATAPGLPDRAEARSAYRSRLSDADAGLPPNPFVAGEVADHLAWLRGPGRRDGTGISLAADIAWDSRPDVRAAFPDVRHNDRGRFVDWLWTHGLLEGATTAAVLPERTDSPRRVPAGPRPRVFGVNLVGYLGSEAGLGVAARLVGGALDAAGIPWAPVSSDRTASRQRGRDVTTLDAPYWFNLVLAAPDQFPLLVSDLGASLLEHRYTIGLWYWETDVLTEPQMRALDLVDEVWGATTYLRNVFAANTNKAVVRVPVPLEFDDPQVDASTRVRLGLDDRFTFLFTFDFLSITERKNPRGVIEAYRRAFGPDEGTRLIVKSINGDLHLRELEALRASIADRPDVECRDGYLDGADRLALVEAADCYVSLHRSEGLGLTMAEAMALGTPVIATGYSGNLDFMPAGSAILVDHDLIAIGPGHHYPPSGRWAAPDLVDAARAMRRVRNDPELAADLARRGREALRPFGTAEVARQIRDRLRAIWR